MTFSPVFTSIDTQDTACAARLITDVGSITHIKLGLEYFLAQGPQGIAQVRPQISGQFFLDLKLHDIPNTVARAVKSLLPLKVDFTTLHASGGPAMLKAAASVEGRPKLLAVTVLTSLGDDDMASMNQPGSIAERVVRYARMARECGCDGIVAAPTEIVPLRQALGADFLIVTPGIRPTGAEQGDQKRVMTPAEALRAGANYLVIGRPITDSPKPGDAAQAIAAECSNAKHNAA